MTLISPLHLLGGSNLPCFVFWNVSHFPVDFLTNCVYLLMLFTIRWAFLPYLIFLLVQNKTLFNTGMQSGVKYHTHSRFLG